MPSHIQAPARSGAHHQNFGEKEKTRVLALLRHIHLPYSVASDEKLLETSHGLGTGVVPRRRAIARQQRAGGENDGTRLERRFKLKKLHEC